MEDQNNKQDEIIQEAEIVSEDETSESVSDDTVAKTPAADQATVLLSLEELIKSHISSLDRLSTELKKHREMFDDAFQNNPTFREHNDRVKEANKAKASVHDQIVKQPAVRDLANKIKDFRIELKEKQMALSDYLQEYQRMTGVNEIEGPDGELREIVNSAKLIKKAMRKAA